MKAERDEKSILIELSADEVFMLQAGNTVGDRVGVTNVDAKVEIIPLSAIAKDDSARDRLAHDRLKKGLAAQLKGTLFPNGDLQVAVPAIKLADVRIQGANLPRTAIEAPLTEKGEDFVAHVIPELGVVLRFGGSLQIINTPNYFE